MRNFLVRSSLLVLMIAPALMLLDAAAQAQSPGKETDSLYIGNRVTLSVSAPRQLTLNAHIVDFDWSPDGKRIAFFSCSDDASDTAIRVTRADSSQQRTYFEGRVASGDDRSNPNSSAVYTLFGWSSDGSKIAFGASVADPMTKQTGPVLIVADASTGSLVTAPVPAFTDTKHVFDIIGKWSPNQNLFAYVVVGTADAGGQTSHLLLYDAQTRESCDLIPTAENAALLYWIDGTHLLASANVRGKRQRLLIDVISGQANSTSSPINHNLLHSHDSTGRLGAGSAGVIVLSLLRTQSSATPDTFTLAPAVDAQGKSHRPAVHLWVSVLREPHGRAAKTGRKQAVAPQLLIDSYRHDSMQDVFDLSTDFVKFAPVPYGTAATAHLAYLISGDLYVSTIASRAASVQELIAAGETLTCAEEQQLAASDAKELALGVLQYTQDYDEHYPLAGNFHDEVFPYIKSDEVFRVGGHDFQFSLDGDTMASLDDPAHTEMGDFDLPCGRVVAYADGNVKILKPGE